jgi:hypothetical protein
MTCRSDNNEQRANIKRMCDGQPGGLMDQRNWRHTETRKALGSGLRLLEMRLGSLRRGRVIEIACGQGAALRELREL